MPYRMSKQPKLTTQLKLGKRSHLLLGDHMRSEKTLDLGKVILLNVDWGGAVMTVQGSTHCF